MNFMLYLCHIFCIFLRAVYYNVSDYHRPKLASA